MVFMLKVLHLWISYQMDGFGDVMDAEGRVVTSLRLYE
jgi:hypothetical protein